MKLKIVEKIAKEHPFNSRNWNYQKNNQVFIKSIEIII